MSNKITLTDRTELMLKELAAPDTDVPGSPPRVMTLLRNKKLNPEDVPEELLMLTDSSGMSVLDLCIERFQEPVLNKYNQLIPRALYLAGSSGKQGTCLLPLHFRKIETILTIKDNYGNAVAHKLAEQDLLPEEMMTEEIFRLEDWYDCSVAYILASRDTLPEWAKYDKNILMLGQGRYSVACALARNGKLPEETLTQKILILEDHNCWNVACILAEHNLLPEWTIHKHGRSILTLKKRSGKLLAAILARHGTLPLEIMTPELLQNQRLGYTVLEVLVRHRHLNPEILELPWNRKTFVFEYVQKKEFRKNMDTEDLVYVDAQLKNMQLKKMISDQTNQEIQEMER